MSGEVIRDTQAELDAILRDHIAAETDGAILTDYIICAASTLLDDIGTGRTLYTLLAAPDQPAHISLGLVTYAFQFGEADNDD